MVSSSRTDDKHELILWHTTKFAVGVAVHLALPPPIAEAATRANQPAPAPAIRRTADNDFVEEDDGMDEETIRGLRDLSIGRLDIVALALGRALGARRLMPLVTFTFSLYLDTTSDQITA
jgi:hypothetical protein